MVGSGEPREIEPVYAYLGRRLAAVRKQRGLTQEMLSDRAGVSANYLARTEGGYHRPNLAKLENIAHALDITIASLFSAQDEPIADRILPALRTELEALSRDDQRLILQLAKRLGEGTGERARPRADRVKRKASEKLRGKR
jgi:transcriptional regulator with XRE-family HTH domain